MPRTQSLRHKIISWKKTEELQGAHCLEGSFSLGKIRAGHAKLQNGKISGIVNESSAILLNRLIKKLCAQRTVQGDAVPERRFPVAHPA
jgi:hypothetical protein